MTSAAECDNHKLELPMTFIRFNRIYYFEGKRLLDNDEQEEYQQHPTVPLVV